MIRRQRGSTMVVTVLGWTAFLICLGIAVDLGRLFVFREQLRTAADAAALAGAMQIERMVRVRIPREVWESKECPGPEPESEPVDCSEYVPAAPAEVSGTMSVVWDQRRIGSVCTYPYSCAAEAAWSWSCWLAPKGDWDAPRQAASQVFQRNAAWGSEAQVTSLLIQYDSSSRYRDFEVTVDATLSVPTLLMAGFGHRTVPVGLPPDQRPARAAMVRTGGLSRPPC